MGVINKLERRFGRYAIANLMAYIVGAEGIVYLFSRTPQGQGIATKLAFNSLLISQGEYWRLISFIFIPPTFSIWVFFILYFYYLLGTRLEQEWGSLRFNIYYFTGVASTIVAASLAHQAATAMYLNLSIFLAFATIDPDFSVLLLFVIPVKIKYLAWLSWLFVAFTIIAGPLPEKILASVSILNYFLFFGHDISSRWKTRAANYPRRRAFQAQASRSKVASIHRCSHCGITEKDNPQMDFRYCSQCAGHHEYCMPDLGTHEHIKAE